MAQAPSPIRSRKFVWIVVAAFAVVVAITVASYVLRARSVDAGATDLTAEELLALPVAVTAADMTRRTGVEPWHDGDLCVEYSGGSFESACFHWLAEQPDHVSAFSFHRSTENPDIAEIVEILQGAVAGKLGQPTNGSRHFHWAGAGISIATDGTQLSASVNPSQDPRWRYRLELLWRICIAALDGRSPEIDEVTRRQWLGQGHPLTILATFDIHTSEERAAEELTRVVPGCYDASAGRDTPSTHEFRVAVDHPWFSSATLVWTPLAARPRSIFLLPHASTFDHRQAVGACLTDALGPSPGADLAGLLDWQVDDLGHVELDAGRLTIAPGGSDQVPSNASWIRLLRALDACPEAPPAAAE